MERRATHAERVKKIEAEILEAKHEVSVAMDARIEAEERIRKATARVDALEAKLIEVSREQI